MCMAKQYHMQLPGALSNALSLMTICCDSTQWALHVYALNGCAGHCEHLNGRCCLKDSMATARYVVVSGANSCEGTHCQLD